MYDIQFAVRPLTYNRARHFVLQERLLSSELVWYDVMLEVELAGFQCLAIGERQGQLMSWSRSARGLTVKPSLFGVFSMF